MRLQQIVLVVIAISNVCSRGIRPTNNEGAEERCKMTKFNATIIVDRCQPVLVATAMCIGTCSSGATPEFKDFKSTTTQTCKYCLPIVKRRKIKLRCKKRQKGYKIKLVDIVTDCKCKKPAQCVASTTWNGMREHETHSLCYEEPLDEVINILSSDLHSSLAVLVNYLFAICLFVVIIVIAMTTWIFKSKIFFCLTRYFTFTTHGRYHGNHCKTLHENRAVFSMKNVYRSCIAIARWFISLFYLTMQ